jgi:hypothetical protein
VPWFYLAPVTLSPLLSGQFANSCAAGHPAAEFSNLLQQPNVKDYMARVKVSHIISEMPFGRLENLSQYAAVGFSDLRLA